VLIDGLPLEAPAAPLGDLPRVGFEAGSEELGLVSEGPGASADVNWPHDFDRLLESEPLPPAPQPDPAEPAAIFFTSGSTGSAKGVTHTRESLRWMIASAAAAFELGPEDVFLPGSSMSHIGSFPWALSTLSRRRRGGGLEGALNEHPAIALAGAVGVHDEVHGENVRAYVTLREGAERPTAADLIVHCRERIGHKAPEEILFLDEMPLNPTGKIDRVGLKRMAEEHLHPHGLD